MSHRHRRRRWTVDGGALLDNKIQLANVCTASPIIKTDNLVVLKDPDILFFPHSLAPIVSLKVTTKAADILNTVNV